MLGMTTLWARIGAYLAGEGSPEERAETRRWIQQRPTRRALAADAQKLWRVETRQHEWDVDAMAARLAERMREAGVRPVVERGASRSLPDVRYTREGWRRRRDASRRRTGILAAAGVALVVAGAVWRFRSGVGDAARLAVVESARGQTATIRLDDGTQVILGPESRLRYPTRFGRGERTVFLEGHGFFSVTHDAGHPFTVRTARASISDLGTAFDVRAHSNDPEIEIIVTSGRVAVRALGGDTTASTIVAAGQSVRLTAGQSLPRVLSIDDPHVTDWRSGRLHFHDEPVADLVRALRRWYDVDIDVPDESLANAVITADYLRDEPVAQVVRSLALALRADIVWTGDRAVVLQRRPRN